MESGKEEPCQSEVDDLLIQIFEYQKAGKK